jgi:hypothetical protein
MRGNITQLTLKDFYYFLYTGGMTKGTAISLGLGVTALVIAGGLYAYRGGLTAENREATTTPSQTASSPQGKKMAFYQFAQQGGSYACTVHQLVNNMETTGTVYMNQGMIRGEWNTDYQGKAVDTHFIVRDNTTYVWSSLMKGTGYRLANDAAVNVEGSGAASGTITPNAYMQEIGDYDCEPWKADMTMFDLPAGINFINQATITH